MAKVRVIEEIRYEEVERLNPDAQITPTFAVSTELLMAEIQSELPDIIVETEHGPLLLPINSLQLLD